MKHSAIFILGLLMCFTTLAQVKQKTDYKHIKSFYTDLDNDNKPDTISISSSLDQHFYFNRITIKLSGGQKQTFTAKNSWTTVDKDFLDSNKNELKTDMFFLKKTGTQSVILLFGEIDGAGYRGDFSIINIENGNIKMVFNDYDTKKNALDIQLPKTLANLGNNERLYFVYKNLDEMEKQVKGGNVGSYDPYFVYEIADNFGLDTALTKAYNDKHYIYAGLKFGDIKIFYPDDKRRKLRIWHMPKSLK